MTSDFFHIAMAYQYPWSRHAPLKSGDVLTTTDVNPFFNYYLNSYYPTETVKTPSGEVSFTRLQVLQELKEGRFTNPNSQHVARMGFETAKYFSNYARELIWENVRREEFLHLPSRQRCAWLAQGEANLEYWLKRIGKKEEEINVFRVVPNGSLHTASDEHLLVDVEPYDLTLQKARKYWSGIVTNPVATEILFEGTLEIKELIK